MPPTNQTWTHFTLQFSYHGGLETSLHFTRHFFLFPMPGFLQLYEQWFSENNSAHQRHTKRCCFSQTREVGTHRISLIKLLNFYSRTLLTSLLTNLMLLLCFWCTRDGAKEVVQVIPWPKTNNQQPNAQQGHVVPYDIWHQGGVVQCVGRTTRIFL